MYRLLLALFLVGCSSDYSLRKVVHDNEPGDRERFPDIHVTPGEAVFGSLQVLLQETFEETFYIYNHGDADLDVLSIYLESNDGTFSLQQNESVIIEPGLDSTFVTIFHPDSSGEKYDYILIESNDPDEPLLRIPLGGEGLAPQIEVDPIYYDYGNPYIGCSNDFLTSIKNIGTTNLTVSRITYSGTIDLNFDIDIATYGEAPWLLYPGEEIIGSASYEAHDDTYDLGYLTVESNDPLYPVTVATHEGDAVPGGTITDSFIQTELEEVDILFVVDNSGSMGDMQSSISANSSVFITALNAAGADFRIAVITTDDPNFVGPVLDPTYPSLETEFQSQILVGTSGSAMEPGLQMAYEATSTGGDADPLGSFMRPDATFSVVFISDEDDRSSASVSSFYVPWFQSLKSNPSKVILNAVADDPYGTDSCGDPAFRYDEAVTATSGIFTSICSTDWAVDLEDLANGSITSNLDFHLSELAIESTIEVYVNGAPVYTGWTYDPVENAVVFEQTTAPSEGANIDITYGHYIDCP